MLIFQKHLQRNYNYLRKSFNIWPTPYALGNIYLHVQLFSYFINVSYLF